MTSKSSSRASFKKQIIVLGLGLALFAVLLIMPQPEGMSFTAQRMLAVAVLMAVWWVGEGAPIPVTALLPLFLFPVLGILPSKAIASTYSNHLIFLFLGGFMIALAMEKWEFHRRLALHVIAFIGVSVRKIVLGFMVATAFLSMWISNTAATLMMLPVGIAVVRQIALQSRLGEECNQHTARRIEENLGLVLMLGVAYSASIGGVGTLIGTPPNLVLAGVMSSLFPERPEISFVQWMKFAIPLVVLFVPLVWVCLCRFVALFPLQDIQFGQGGSAWVRDELNTLGPMTRPEKWVAGIFFVTAFLWMFREPLSVGAFTLPGWSGGFEHPEFIHDSTVAMGMGILLMVLPINGRQGWEARGRKHYFLMDWKTLQAGVPWGILILFGGGFALAHGFRVTGLDQWVGLKLSGVLELPIFWMVLLICLGVTFLTELTSNTATATMLFPILAGIAASSELDVLYLLIPAAISASFAFMLPVATPPNAIVFGSGWVNIPQMARAGVLLNFLGAFLTTFMALLSIRLFF